jgi:hypothetical protein
MLAPDAPQGYGIRGREMRRLSGEDAWRALSLAATETAAITLAAKKNGLPWGAYGIVGTCLNSVCEVDLAGQIERGEKEPKAIGSPMIGHKKIVGDAFADLAKSKNPAVAANAVSLAKALEIMPDDTAPKTDADLRDGIRRLAESTPYDLPKDAPVVGARTNMKVMRRELSGEQAGR